MNVRVVQNQNLAFAPRLLVSLHRDGRPRWDSQAKVARQPIPFVNKRRGKWVGAKEFGRLMSTNAEPSGLEQRSLVGGKRDGLHRACVKVEELLC
jgi:hypothetical protein